MNPNKLPTLVNECCNQSAHPCQWMLQSIWPGEQQNEFKRIRFSFLHRTLATNWLFFSNCRATAFGLNEILNTTGLIVLFIFKWILNKYPYTYFQIRILETDISNQKTIHWLLRNIVENIYFIIFFYNYIDNPPFTIELNQNSLCIDISMNKTAMYGVYIYPGIAINIHNGSILITGSRLHTSFHNIVTSLHIKNHHITVQFLFSQCFMILYVNYIVIS